LNQDGQWQGCAERPHSVFIMKKEIPVSSDPSGLLIILEKHGAELLALFTRLTLRAGVAEDLLQELFLKLRSAPGFATAENRKAYAFRTALHLAVDWQRAHRQTEPLRNEPATGLESPLDQLVDAEELAQVLDALPQLSELGRQVVVMHYLQHQDYAEIAELLGKTEHQVRGLCYKALAQLRTILAPAIDESAEY
jgi:RNA polymerase sigma-70 factor (ECF subfamily)